MISNFFNPQSQIQSQPKPTTPSPFFMFLVDQHTNGKSTDMKSIDVAANAIKEWDEKANLQDEYTARSLEEAEKYNFLMSSNVQLPAISEPKANFAFDSNGKVSTKFENRVDDLNSQSHQKDLCQASSSSKTIVMIK